MQSSTFHSELRLTSSHQSNLHPILVYNPTSQKNQGSKSNVYLHTLLSHIHVITHTHTHTHTEREREIWGFRHYFAHAKKMGFYYTHVSTDCFFSPDSLQVNLYRQNSFFPRLNNDSIRKVLQLGQSSLI